MFCTDHWTEAANAELKAAAQSGLEAQDVYVAVFRLMPAAKRNAWPVRTIGVKDVRRAVKGLRSNVR